MQEVNSTIVDIAESIDWDCFENKSGMYYLKPGQIVRRLYLFDDKCDEPILIEHCA